MKEKEGINWGVVFNIVIFLMAFPLGYHFVKSDYNLIYIIVWLTMIYLRTFYKKRKF